MQKPNKKGQLANVMSGLQVFILGIAGVTIMLVVVLIMLANVKTVSMPCNNVNVTIINSSHLCCGAAWYTNASGCMLTSAVNGTVAEIPGGYTAGNSVINKLGEIPAWIGIIIIVALAFIVLSFFYGKKSGGNY
jgi:hypothetical protein